MSNNRLYDKEDPEYQEFNEYDYELSKKVPYIIWTKDMKDTDLNTAANIITELNKALSKEKKKPKKSVKNYNIKSERELF